MNDFIRVPRKWLETLLALSKEASKYNEKNPGGEYSALIGYASSAETALKLHPVEEEEEMCEYCSKAPCKCVENNNDIDDAWESDHSEELQK